MIITSYLHVIAGNSYLKVSGLLMETTMIFGQKPKYRALIFPPNILSPASEVGSSTNPPWAPGSNETRGQGSFGPSTGGSNTH